MDQYVGANYSRRYYKTDFFYSRWYSIYKYITLLNRIFEFFVKNYYNRLNMLYININ
jgi:hypothetical protein